jgi:hypothetical protein
LVITIKLSIATFVITNCRIYEPGLESSEAKAENEELMLYEPDRSKVTWEDMIGRWR